MTQRRGPAFWRERVDRRAPHFHWWEFVDWHVGASPPLAARPALHHLVLSQLEPLRARYGPVRIFSAYRTLATNRSVGGAPESHHLYDRWPKSPAVDIACRDGAPTDWARWLDGRHVGGLGTYGTHVHLDLRPGRARWLG